MLKYFDDVLIVAGVVCCGYGCYLIYPPLAWVVVGVALYFVGLLAAWGNKR